MRVRTRPAGKTSKHFFSWEELGLACAVAADADPDEYVNPLVKAVIVKCKAVIEAGEGERA